MNADPISASSDEPLENCARLLLSDPAAAAAQLREFVAGNPLSAEAYRLLAHADRAIAASSPPAGGGVLSTIVSAAHMRLQQAARALQEDDLEPAEIILRQRLRQAPDDVEALRLMANFGTRLGYHVEAEKLLLLAKEFDPDFTAAQLDLALVQYQQNRPNDAVAVLNEVLQRSPDNLDALNLKADALTRLGSANLAAEVYEASLRLSPRQAKTWSHYGQLLRIMGRQADSVDALRRAIELAPSSGEAWWSLSDLKTFKFGHSDIGRMQEALSGRDASERDSVYLHFALAKAFEDCGDYASGFDHFQEGNRLQKAALSYDPTEVSDYVEAVKLVDRELDCTVRRNSVPEIPDSIFVLGMPRAGSTLVEQILGSHPSIEATMELPVMLDLVDGLASDLRELPAKIARMDAAQLSALGRQYLDRTRHYRLTDRPLFVDKMPNNWLHVPLIQSILPNARIIDVRRHPLDCCLSNFKQMFLGGQGFSNDLAWLGRYFSDYVGLMHHVDERRPGQVHRVIYEQLIEDPEREVRRLLDYVDVEFDPACLRFHESERVVRTASADQVRRPINRQGIGSWRPYEPWIGPLKDALGPVLDYYPEAPPKRA